MNLATAIVLLVVFAMLIVAIHFLRMGKGNCSCSSEEKKAKGDNKCASCMANCPLKRK